MDLELLEKGIGKGKVTAEHLLGLLAAKGKQFEKTQLELQAVQQQLAGSQKRVKSLGEQLGEARKQIDELQRKLGGPPQKLDLNYSVQGELRRQQQREDRHKTLKRKLAATRSGRVKTVEKIARAERIESVYPERVARDKCRLSHTRVVWRLEEGRAVLVAYEVWRGPGNCYGQVPGVVGRSEFDIEIMVAVSFLVYQLGLSFEKVCTLLGFFQQLKLRKSQIDAMLFQLARHWEEQFDTLCMLLANSAIVHADETSWSINSVWAFLGEKARVVLYGVHKDAATLKEILDPATFKGLLTSDDAAVYANFTKAQKCWAHLLRKAIKLTLLEPDNAEFRRFTDRLLEIYTEACRVQKDGRFSPAGRAGKVDDLDDQLLELCYSVWSAELPPLEGPNDAYRLLCNELMELMLEGELFQFVTAPPVTFPNGQTQEASGTNNEAERTLRNPAGARDTERTNKTVRGARRQSVIVTVLESLRCYLPDYTIQSVIAETTQWLRVGRSCFERLAKRLKLKRQPSSSPSTLLDRLLGVPSG